MKYSLFNSIIGLTEKSSLIYNSFTDSFLVFTNTLSDDIQNNIIKIKNNDIDLYNQLLDMEAYVDDRLDEIERLELVAKQTMLRDSDYFIIINPTMSCNYNCWYCYESHIKNSKMSDKVMESVKLHISKVITENKNLKEFPISFFGGEPLIYFKSIVLPLIQHHNRLCKENNIVAGISFTSNGGLITEYIVNELSKYNNVHFQITLDGGKTQHNQVRFSMKGDDSYSSIIKNIKLLVASKINVRVRINYTKENLSSLSSIVNDINDIPAVYRKYIEVDFHWVWQEKDLSVEMDGIRDVVNCFSENGLPVIFNDIDTIRNSCYGDRSNTAVINYNGDVFKCTAQDFTTENRVGILNDNGEITWSKSQEERQNYRFKNQQCRICRIAPLCAGGCTRYMCLNKDKIGTDSYCLFKTQERIEEVVLDRFDMYLRNK